MHIKFDEYILQEFFESEPVCIGGFETGMYLYSLEKNDFKIVFSVNIYACKIGASISRNEKIIFSGNFREVSEIKESDKNALRVITKNGDIIVKKNQQLGLILEEND